MELKVHRPTCRCANSGRPILAGEEFYSALVRAEGSLGRVDVATEAWTGPPEHSIAWWRSTMPPADAKGPSLASPDVLLDVLERLEGVADEQPLRYLLALFLVRRRVLRLSEHREVEGGDPLLLRFHCPRRATEYAVRATPPDGGRTASEGHDASTGDESAVDPASGSDQGGAAKGAAKEIEQRLTSLLWSGEAA